MAENSHSFGAYYKRATSPLAVLRLLKERPMYGYEISQAMKKKKRGPVYHCRALSGAVPAGGAGLCGGGPHGGHP